jgi:hypothetical protein
MYGMYLLATRGIKKSEKTTTHKPDVFGPTSVVEVLVVGGSLGPTSGS